MTEQQQQFLRLNSVEGKTYEQIRQHTGFTRSEMSAWYEALVKERTAINAVRILWSRKKTTVLFPEFYDWYLTLERKCGYCGITEADIARLLTAGLLTTKRLATRGRKLELDRCQPEVAYSELENLTLACYWCNNAKTDTFTAEEFQLVGKAFADIWRARLARLPSTTDARH